MRNWALSILVTVTMVMAVAAIAVPLFHEEANQHAANYGNCHRQNVLRAIQTSNQLGDYNFKTTELTLLATLPHTKPTAKNAAILRAYSVYLASLRQDVASEQWVPLTNCTAAVSHAASYVPGPPIRFVRRLPGVTDMTVGVGQ